jgi:hypothetical protein
MAARTFSPKHDEQTRLKIKTTQLINRLMALAEGKVEMPPHAVTAALGLLRKVLPDLSAQELSGGVSNYVARLPTPAKTVEAWEQSVTSQLPNTKDAKAKALN